jgi:hypothetical protein
MRVGERAAMFVLGTTAAERRHREMPGVERHVSSSPSRSREAPKPSRGGGRHVLGSKVPHGRSEAQVGCAAETWRCQASARREPLLEGRHASYWQVASSGAPIGRPTVMALGQVKARGQPLRWRLGTTREPCCEAGRSHGIGRRGTTGMWHARRRGFLARARGSSEEVTFRLGCRRVAESSCTRSCRANRFGGGSDGFGSDGLGFWLLGEEMPRVARVTGCIDAS